MLSRPPRAAPLRAMTGLAAVGLLAVAGCGSSAAPSTSSGAAPTPTTTPAPTPLTISTPGPSDIQVTLTGDARVSGPLVTGTLNFVRCENPTLSGETIYVYGNTAASGVAALLTIRNGSIDVRLAAGSGTVYTSRMFDGTGVTSFGAASGAQFSSSLTETQQPGASKGTIPAVSSISGSVSCGTFQPGSGAITVSGTTPDGGIDGTLSSLRVVCTSTAQGEQSSATGLTHVGSAPAAVTLGGGVAGSPFYVVLTTASTSRQYLSSAAGVVTTTSGTITYNGTASTTATASAPALTVTVSGTATCGT